MFDGHTDKIALVININQNVFTDLTSFKHRFIE